MKMILIDVSISYVVSRATISGKASQSGIPKYRDKLVVPTNYN